MLIEHFKTTIKNEPRMKLKQLKERIKDQLKVGATTITVRRVRKMVLHKLAENYIEKFVILRDYVNEFLDKNLGFIVILNVDRVTSYSSPMFKRIYICLSALKKERNKVVDQ